MGYFEFHDESRNDPRVHRLCRSLRIAIPYGLGHLALLRSWASSEKFRAFTGDLSEFTPEQIAKAAEYSSEDPQKAIEWAKALIASELIIRDPAAPEIQLGEPLNGHATLADWLELCGDTCRRRIERRSVSDNVGQAQDSVGELLSLCSSGSSSRAVTPIWKLYLVYKFVKKGKDRTELKDERWDKINTGMNMPWLKKILEAYENDLKKSAKAVLEIGDYFEGHGLTWNSSTVYKRLTDWEEGRLGRN